MGLLRNGQLKQGFFNQLNEAFAYEFLARRGFSVRMIEETGKKQPDMCYSAGLARHCEVKSIGVSQDQIDLWEAEDGFSSSIYQALSAEFMVKLTSTISAVWTQVTANGSSGLVYVLIFFDDWTLTHYSDDRRQIVKALAAHPVHDKIGLLGNRRVEKDPLGLRAP